MDIRVFDLGLVDYEHSYEFQKHIFDKVKSGEIDSALVICRHHPVFTLGRGADKNNILAASGIKTRETERGGDVTYHGPGQLTVYPVFNLAFFKKDIHWFLRQLEETTLDLLSDFGVKAQRQSGFTGVWIKEEKIASIGIAIRSWISFHGVSINIMKDDLLNYGLIRPCGMDIKMTSLETVLGKSVDIDAVKKVAAVHFLNFASAGRFSAI